MGAFKSYAIHQYSSAGRLTGFRGNLDLNIAYMTADACDKYAKPAECAVEKRATIKFGSRGTDVTYLQQRFTARGYGVSAIDGIFGSKTLEAIKALQAENELVIDGIVGSKTWMEMPKV